jgi:hypothetical protein
VGIEVKAAQSWRSEWGTALKDLHASGAIDRAFGVYLGPDELVDGPVRVLPYSSFVKRLGQDELLEPAASR